MEVKFTDQEGVKDCQEKTALELSWIEGAVARKVQRFVGLSELTEVPEEIATERRGHSTP